MDDATGELRDALDRLRATLDDLVARGLRSAGPRELSRVEGLRDEFRAAGAVGLAARLTELADLVRADDRDAAAALLRVMTAARLFERMLTLEAVGRAFASAGELEA